MRNRTVYLLLLIIGIYLVVSLSRSIYSLSQKTSEIDKAKSRVEDEFKKNTDLSRELNSKSTLTEIEKTARDKLNMSKPGESLVIIPENLVSLVASDAATATASFYQRQGEIPNWKKWWMMFVGK